ncbi:MAG: hypothetical protein IPP25_15375 [Saprospiraceae bacterium]|nr:hypothetical protein [Candidatus Opimibacter skivensis]
MPKWKSRRWQRMGEFMNHIVNAISQFSMKSDHLPLRSKFCKAFLLILLSGSLPWMQSTIYAQPVNDKCEMATQLPLDAFSGTFFCIEDSIDGAQPDPLHEEFLMFRCFQPCGILSGFLIFHVREYTFSQ